MADEGLNLIPKSDLEAPLKLADNYEIFAKVLTDVRDIAKEQSDLINNDKSVKELTDRIKALEGQNKKLSETQKKVNDESIKAAKNNKNHAEAISVLDQNTGGFINRLKQMGSQLAIIAKSPFFLILAAAVATLAALTSAARTFFTTTGEGEDMLARQSAQWNQFFNTLKNGWKELGKSVTSFAGEDISGRLINSIFEIAKVAFPFFIIQINKMQKEFNRTSKEAVELANAIDNVETRIAANIKKRADTEAETSELLFKLNNLEKDQLHEKLKLLDDYIAKKREQLSIDLEIAKDNAKNVLYAIGLEHNLTQAQVDRMSEAERDAEFTGAEMKKIAESYAAVKKLQSDFNMETRKGAKMRITILEEIHKEDVKKAMDAAQAKVDIAKAEVQKRIEIVKAEAIQGLITKEDAEKRFLDIKRAYADQLVQIEIEALEKVLALNLLNAEERAEVEKKLAQLKIDLTTAQYNQLTELKEVTVETYDTMLKQVSDMYSSFVGSLGELFNSFTENRLNEIDKMEERQTAYYDNLLRMAGDNEERKSEIEAEADRKRQELERRRVQALRRAAIFEKVTSLIQAGINTALAVTNQLSSGDPYTAFARALVAGIAGGIQVAAIAAKQIPQYAKGTKNHPGGWAIVGEEGSEAYREPGGNYKLSPDRATAINLASGSEVITAEETAAMLATNGLLSGMPKRRGGSFETLGKKLDNLNHTMKNKKELHINYSKEGAEAVIIAAANKIKMLNDFYH